MIRIDVTSSRPLEEQIAAALKQALARGELRAGDELPSSRQLAGDLGVHWNTVARAFRRLADEGLLLVRRGRSVTVRSQAEAHARVARGKLGDRFAEAIAVGLLGGMSSDEIAHVFQEALARFGGGRHG